MRSEGKEKTGETRTGRRRAAFYSRLDQVSSFTGRPFAIYPGETQIQTRVRVCIRVTDTQRMPLHTNIQVFPDVSDFSLRGLSC